MVGSAIWRDLQGKGFDNLIGRESGELDLRDARALKAFFEAEKPEYVFLAAAKVGGIMANNTYRADFIYDNLQIQQNVIGESFRSGVKKLLFLGSTCIYPKDAPQPMKEESLLTGPLEYTNEPYAIAKIAGLKMCESFNIQYGTDFIAVMPTNLYGPGDNFDLGKSHVLPAMIRKIFLSKMLGESNTEALRRDLDARPVDGVAGAASLEEIEKALAGHGVYPGMVELWGTGKPLREFLWSEDMADASVFVMMNTGFSDLAGEGKEIRNCHINIGSGREISISGLAGLIAGTIGFGGEIRFDASKPDGTMRKLTDVSKLKNLGWEYKTTIEDGVRRLYEWYIADIGL